MIIYKENYDQLKINNNTSLLQSVLRSASTELDATHSKIELDLNTDIT